MNKLMMMLATLIVLSGTTDASINITTTAYPCWSQVTSVIHVTNESPHDYCMLKLGEQRAAEFVTDSDGSYHMTHEYFSIPGEYHESFLICESGRLTELPINITVDGKECGFKVFKGRRSEGSQPVAVPEFTTLAAAIAIGLSVTGFLVLRKKE